MTTVAPARAGMDRGSTWPATRWSGCPRASGDEPCGGLAEDRVTVVAPARAGMDPSKTRWATACCSRPRASGDGPDVWREMFEGLRSPPLERGWTHGGLAEECVAVVSPARERGWTVELREPAHHGQRRLRASGDGPVWPFTIQAQA